MLWGVLTGVVGFAALGVAYYNRDNLDQKPRWRVVVPYVVGIIVVLAAALAVVAETDQPTLGPPTRNLQ